ncbi:MAG: CoA-binding protein [Tissierella sp.]|uniref:CoA-binding protein n=1 Tax=Tissierella sp. TaxID=41274 RepID=UPI003F96EDF7
MDFTKIKQEMLEKKKWAVIGVSQKKDRWGYKIWKKLKEHNYETYGISPNYEEIEGEKIYSSIIEIPEMIDVLDMVVSPKIGMNILDEAKASNIEYIFFQPGTYNEKVIEKASSLGFKYLIDDCIYATLKREE